MPRSLKPVASWLKTAFGVSISTGRLSVAVRAMGFRYKRMRKSMKQHRDDVLFDFFRQELGLLHQMEEKGELDVYYFDETGINLAPVVPYGWQRVGETHQLSSLPSKNQTLVGFMNKSCNFYGFRFDGAATAATTVACMDQFAGTIKKKTVVVLDNATIHKAGKVTGKKAEWEEKGLFLQFIPAYCPELNLIERLWLEFKYRWLDKPSYFDSENSLLEAIDQVVRGIGTKYTINFD